MFFLLYFFLFNRLLYQLLKLCKKELGYFIMVYSYFPAILKDLNYSFSTTSDTEVLLAGLESGGMEWLKKWKPEFAARVEAEYKKAFTK